MIADQIGSKLARNQNRVLDRRMALLQIAEPAPQMLPRETPSVDEYRAMADLCLNWARQPLTKDAHRFCVTLARVWLRAAISQDAAISDCSRKSPLVFDDRKVLIEDRLGTEDRIKSVGYSFGRPDVSNKLFESGGASDPERAHSLPKLALRDYLRVAILALTVGATSGAGAVLALVGPSAQQRITSLARQSPMATMEHAANYSAAEPAYDRRKVDGETPEHAAPRGPPVAAASAAMRASSPNEPASPGTDQTSALDVTSSLEGTTSKEPNNAPLRVERKRHGRVAVGNHDWRPRDRFVFLPLQRDARQLFSLRLF